MSHAHAALTPRHRLRLARLIVEDGRPPSRAAEFFNVTWATAGKWAKRYLAEGPEEPVPVDECLLPHGVGEGEKRQASEAQADPMSDLATHERLGARPRGAPRPMGA